MLFGRGRKLFGLRPLLFLLVMERSVKDFTHLDSLEWANFSTYEKSCYEKFSVIVDGDF